MKNLPIYFLATLFIAVLVLGCNKGQKKSDTISVTENIDLADGFYFLNGADYKYAVRRKGIRETYVLNPIPIFKKDDYGDVKMVPGVDGKFSLDVSLKENKAYKWDQVLESVSHYIGYVYNKELRGLIKIKGDDSRDDVFLDCVSVNKKEAGEMIAALVN